MRNFSIVNRTQGKTPRLPFEKIKNAILGNGYDLSLAFVVPAEARRITRKTKHENKASNVLAFSLSKKSGEILMCPARARRQAPAYGYDQATFIARLFIHGCFHLKGLKHGVTMEKRENQIARRFGFYA